MNLENEYVHFKQELKSEEEKLAKFESLNENEMNEMQIEAKERGIKRVKASINELEELIEEVKTELKEFIENGGEVSQETLDELKDTEEFETIGVEFKIVSNDNENVYIEGYVNINDEEAEDVDWYYWTGTQYQQSPYYHHDEEQITGLTTEQNDEIDTFKNNYAKDALWIDTVILQSKENENRTYARENCTLIINDGAKMECEIIEHPEIDSYIVEAIPHFNGQKINIAAYMVEMGMDFDPWDVDDGRSYIENGKIFFEMSKDYWDEDSKEELMNDINEEARSIYAMSLTREMCIYSRYGEVMEQSMDNDYDDEWLFKMTQHKDDSEEELDAFLRKEGLIDELDY